MRPRAPTHLPPPTPFSLSLSLCLSKKKMKRRDLAPGAHAPRSAGLYRRPRRKISRTFVRDLVKTTLGRSLECSPDALSLLHRVTEERLYELVQAQASSPKAS